MIIATTNVFYLYVLLTYAVVPISMSIYVYNVCRQMWTVQSDSSFSYKKRKTYW